MPNLKDFSSSKDFFESAPVGTVTPRIAWDDPKWLECDGSAVDGDQYPDLRDVLVAAGLPTAGIPDFNAGGSIVSGTPTLAGTGRGCAFSPDAAFLGTAHYTSPFTTVISANTATLPALPNITDKKLINETPIKIKALP